MDIAQDGNLFPREDILEAVAQSDWRDQPVRPWAWALAALGVFFITLGMPIVDPLTASTVEHSAAHPRNLLHPLHVLAAWIGPATGLGIEFFWYALSSACLALALPAIGMAIRALGVGSRLAFSMSLLAMLSPELLSHGRLPSDFPAGVLGASLLLALTLAPSDPDTGGARGFGIRVAAGLGVATLLHWWSLAAAPAVVLAAWQRGRWTAALPVLLKAAALTLAVFALGSNEGTASALSFHPALPFVVTGLFLALLPLAWLHSEEESPPPAWLTLWLLCGIGGTIVSLATPGKTSTLPMFLPVAVLFAAAALARLARPDNALRLTAHLAAAHAVALILLHVSTPAQEAHGLAVANQDVFEGGDLVLVPKGTSHGRVSYLLRRRFNVQVVELSPAEEITDQLRRQMSGTTHGRLLGVGALATHTPFVLDVAEGTVTPHE